MRLQQDVAVLLPDECFFASASPSPTHTNLSSHSVRVVCESNLAAADSCFPDESSSFGLWYHSAIAELSFPGGVFTICNETIS